MHPLEPIVSEAQTLVRLSEIRADPRVRKAVRFLHSHSAEIEADQIRISQIPAPPFEETPRAEHFRDRLLEAGCTAELDGIGNVVAPYGVMGTDPVVIGAHLDTVFGSDTPLEMRRRGSVIELPGIADNGAGLVALLWLFIAARAAGLVFGRPLVAVADVGEEGIGDLRGIRYLFKRPPWEGLCHFIALDGGGLRRITNRGLGSRRFRMTLAGPGGHSWADFGTGNPIHGLARGIGEFMTAMSGMDHGASYNVGVIEGGISVNAIPSHAHMEVDIRATDQDRLDRMEERLRSAVGAGALEARLDCVIEVIGERPAGVTSPTGRLVGMASEATRLCGAQPVLDVASTDANIPMSMGIPAIAIGAGGSCGAIHTRREWFDPKGRQAGLERLLLLVAGMAGLARPGASVS